MMAGPKPDPSRRKAHHFAETLLHQAHGNVAAWRRVAFGSGALEFGQTRLDDLGHFIDGAFSSATGTNLHGRFAIARHEDVVLTSVDWARPWIEKGLSIPAHLCYPYRIHFDRVTGIAYVLDQRDARAAAWIRQVSELDLRSFVTPFRIMLSWLGNLVGREVVHASASVVDGYGVAFSGPSGSGKSTLALSLALAGCSFISDDCVVIEEELMYPGYARAKIDESGRALLDISDRNLEGPYGDFKKKWVVQPDSADLARCSSHRLDAWVFPALSPSPGWYTIDSRRAVRSLSTDSLREIIGGTTRNRLRLAKLIDRRPAIRLLLGPDVAENIENVKAMVQEIRGLGDLSSVGDTVC